MGFYTTVRSLDLFPTPVGIRYLDGKYYRTFCGGALSLLAVSMILIFSITELIEFIGSYQYIETVVIENLSYKNEREYVITDTQAMIAFQFVQVDIPEEEDGNEQKDVLGDLDNYLSYYFVKYVKENNTFKSEVVNAIYCTEKYERDYPDNTDVLEQFHKTSEDMTDWICPDLEEIELLNNPDTYSSGKSFKLVIDYCN